MLLRLNDNGKLICLSVCHHHYRHLLSAKEKRNHTVWLPFTPFRRGIQRLTIWCEDLYEKIGIFSSSIKTAKQWWWWSICIEIIDNRHSNGVRVVKENKYRITNCARLPLHHLYSTDCIHSSLDQQRDTQSAHSTLDHHDQWSWVCLFPFLCHHQQLHIYRCAVSTATETRQWIVKKGSLLRSYGLLCTLCTVSRCTVDLFSFVLQCQRLGFHLKILLFSFSLSLSFRSFRYACVCISAVAPSSNEMRNNAHKSISKQNNE